MWFVIHVKPGTEARAVDLLRESAKDAGLEELFCPSAVVGGVEHGKAVERELPMISGCVVAVAPSKWEVRRCLRRADGVDCLLAGESSFDEMGDEEVEFIEFLTEPGARTVGMSEGVVERGVVRVERGPLVGREQGIRRLSHRKRRAFLQTSIAGEPVDALVGICVRKAEVR